MEAEANRQITVSVVVPAYNAQSYIAATIESVLAQTFSDFELLVVDDASTDQTPQIVRDFMSRDPRVALITLPENRGAPAGPRNAGVRAARGTWIAFLDADDVWHRDKLACQLATLTATGAKFCSSRMVDFKDERTIPFSPPGNYQLERIGFVKELIKPRTPTSSVVVKKELVARYPFNEAMSFKAREDMDCWLHCHEEIRWSIKIAHPLVGYRIAAGQISGRKWQMVARHYHVLRQYKFRSGGELGAGAALLFTATHFLFAIYYRLVRRGL